MDEDEEIDIIGNYGGFMSRNERDISDISSGQLLSCDYTVHPKWLNENPDGENYWSESVPKHENLENNVEVLQSEEVVIEEPEPVPNITDLEWSGENGNLIFEEDIPATIEEVVTNQDEFGNEFECVNSKDEVPSPPPQPTQQNTETSDKSNKQYLWEPAAFETHPPVENIGYIGPTKSTSLLKVKINSRVDVNPRSLLKPDILKNIEKPPSKFKQTLTIKQSLLKKSRMMVSQIRKKTPNTDEFAKFRQPKTKFKQTVKMTSHSLQTLKLKLIPKKSAKGKTGGKRTGGKGKRNRNPPNIDDANITISHESDTINSTPLEPVKQREKFNASNSESDIEVDVETDNQGEIPAKSVELSDEHSNEEKENNEAQKEDASPITPPESEESDDKMNSLKNFENLSDELVSQLKSLEIPHEELEMDANEVSELERIIYTEYFENRTTKTPEQYLRIRNHILYMWKSSKPNYISKTAARNGLKHGGDVNCISRIHRLLEQIGAINFGCQGRNFHYVRPLEKYMALFIHAPRVRSNSSSNTSLVINNNERRQRVKSNPTQSEVEKESNVTTRHGDGVRRFEPEPLNKHHMRIRPYIRNVKTELQLIKCLKFSKDNIAPFKVSISLSTLLCLQLHLLSSKYEVMGFLGGHRSKSLGRDKISLTRYRPCRTAVQSGTMCEMCPVSQVEQSSKLGEEGYELLGWFHSHPLFPANPSRTDLRTQKEMQNQFAFDNDRPFIGLILSGLNMAFKCIYLMPRQSNFDDDFLPYEIDADIIKDYTNFKVYVRDVLDIIEENCDSTSDLIKKFKSSSSTILRQFGFKNDSFFLDIF